MKRVGAVLALSALLTACGGVSEGRVEGKTYYPESGYYTSICASYNQQGACTVSVPMWNVIPECWGLELYNAGETGTVCVDKETYDRVKLGERWKA
jgi:hypothetical protein